MNKLHDFESLEDQANVEKNYNSVYASQNLYILPILSQTINAVREIIAV
jgi:hypothetical protein